MGRNVLTIGHAVLEALLLVPPPGRLHGQGMGRFRPDAGHRQHLLEILTLTLGTCENLLPAHQQIEPMPACIAGIFVDGHDRAPKVGILIE